MNSGLGCYGDFRELLINGNEASDIKMNKFWSHVQHSLTMNKTVYWTEASVKFDPMSGASSQSSNNFVVAAGHELLITPSQPGGCCRCLLPWQLESFKTEKKCVYFHYFKKKYKL